MGVVATVMEIFQYYSFLNPDDYLFFLVSVESLFYIGSFFLMKF